MLYQVFLAMPYDMLLLFTLGVNCDFLTSDIYFVIVYPTAICGYNVTDHLHEPKASDG